MQELINQTVSLVGKFLPSLLGSVAILIIGWIIAVVFSKISKKLLHKIDLNGRMSGWISKKEKDKSMDVESGIGKGIFYLTMLFVLVAFFQTLGITQITEPINSLLSKIFVFAPQIIGGGILMVAALVCASLLRTITSKALSETNLDKRLAAETTSDENEIDEKPAAATKTLSEAVYWLVLLLFLPAILETLNLGGILGPIAGMVDKTLVFIPNLFAAAVITAIGWFVAKIVQKLATNFLSAVGIDRLSDQIGLAAALGNNNLSRIVGKIVNVIVIIPFMIAGLNALALDAVTQPASNMLNMLLGILPNLFGASLVIAIAYVVGKVVAALVANVLAGVGFNRFMNRIGVKQEIVEGERPPSAVVGTLCLVGIMFFSVMEAADMLGFELLSDLVSQFMTFTGHIAFGLALFGMGIWLANFCAGLIMDSKITQGKILATSARVAILILTGAMALRQMGFANEIVNLAFGLMLGGAATAAAIAFGIGGRDIAASKLNEWQKTISSEAEAESSQSKEFKSKAA